MTIALLLAAALLPCRPVGGTRILGSDLAAAAPALAGIPADAIIGYGPQPGIERVFHANELAGLAKKYGLRPAAIPPELCFERATAPLDPARVVAAMRRSLDAPGARIEILELSGYPAPPGQIVFPREWLSEPATGRTAVWNGYVNFDGGRFTIWARVRIAVNERRVVAAAVLVPRHAIRADQVRIENVEAFPRRTPPVSSLAEAVGWVPRRVIAAGSPLAASALEAPHDVERGDSVSVLVRSGGAVLRLEAKAESAGRRGDRIPLRNPASGRMFTARVEGRGRVVVECHRRDR